MLSRDNFFGVDLERQAKCPRLTWQPTDIRFLTSYLLSARIGPDWTRTLSPMMGGQVIRYSYVRLHPFHSTVFISIPAIHTKYKAGLQFFNYVKCGNFQCVYSEDENYISETTASYGSVLDCRS